MHIPSITIRHSAKKRAVFINLLAVGVFMLVPLVHTKAISANDFNPANIISDAAFTNYTTMSVQDIQNFLNSKVPTCDSNGAQSYAGTTRAAYSRARGHPLPIVCLKDYYENPSSHANNLTVTDGQPAAIPAGAIGAAQIIYNAATTYHINPQVLLVTLQKEQGLVTDDWPWTNQFTTATGYGCPDTSACNTTYYGFYNQVTNAASQYRNYLTNPTHYNYTVGSNYVLYSPASGCGGASINIQNQSTAALYDYTPYQPNGAALAGLSDASAGGTGDGCSSYGNRNFWWYFNTWFGSSQTSTPYAWNLISKNIYTDSTFSSGSTLGKVSIAPGAKGYLQVTARNNGYQTWQQSVVRLGTQSPQDRVSQFADSSWVSGSRIAMQQSSVAPGYNATFNFSVTAPQTPGTYGECFNLVAEGIAWMNNPGLCYTIDVTAPQTASTTVTSQLSAGQSLTTSNYLTSSDLHSVFTLQSDGNLVQYNDTAPVWSDGGNGSAVAKVTMQADGNLVAYTATGTPIWASGTNGNPGSVLKIQNDGNAVIYSAGGSPLWATMMVRNPDGLSYVDYTMSPGTMLFAGQSLKTASGKYSIALQSDGNLVLYNGNSNPVWATMTVGRGATHLAMQADGNLVLYNANGAPVWASATVGRGAANLTMQADGNLVLYNGANKAQWATMTTGATSFQLGKWPVFSSGMLL